MTTGEVIRIVELSVKTSTSFADRMIAVLAKQADLAQNQQGMILQLLHMLGITPHGLQELVRLQRAVQLKAPAPARKVLVSGQRLDSHDQLDTLDQKIMEASRERHQALDEDNA
jgi:hypothetical protein